MRRDAINKRLSAAEYRERLKDELEVYTNWTLNEKGEIIAKTAELLDEYSSKRKSHVIDVDFLTNFVYLFLKEISKHFFRSSPTMAEVLIDIKIRPLDEGGYLATSAELQGLIAQGRTVAETIEIAQDVARK